uniref:Importin N-terminal domain-containing protein n=1 Tax=Glossina pallidipes TaxID=7398 RepID=A0A1A9ZW27_GLOPL
MAFKSVTDPIGYGVYLSELITNQSFDLPLRQIGSVMLTRYVDNDWGEWDEEGNPSEAGSYGLVATDQAKRPIRKILPNGLYDPNSKIRSLRSSVAHTILTIATTDWPSVWTELSGGNENSIHAAMQTLQEFIYNEKQIVALGQVVISEVYRIFESEKNYSIEQNL